MRPGLRPVPVLAIPRDLAEVCALAGMLHWRLPQQQKNASMPQIAITTVWCWKLWLEMQLVCVHSQDQDIPKSRYEPWETCFRSHQHGTLEPVASLISFLSGFLVRLQFFQHIVHYVVLDLLLFGWVELFSLFQSHGMRVCQSLSQCESPTLCHLSCNPGSYPEVSPWVELANMVLLLWFLPDFYFCEKSFSCMLQLLCWHVRGVCLHVSWCVRPRIFRIFWNICGHVHVLTLLETLRGQSMALDESHVLLGRRPPVQTRVSVASDLPSSVVLLD